MSLLNNRVEWEFGDKSPGPSYTHYAGRTWLQRKQLFLVSFQERTDLALLSKLKES